MTRWTATVSLVLGGLGAAVLVVGTRALSTEQALEGWAVLLAVAGTIYIGAALADGRRRPILVETVAGTAFVAAALAGLWHTPVWLVGGWGLHALWDLAHHGPLSGDGCAELVVEEYPLLCLSFDLVVAVAIAIRFL